MNVQEEGCEAQAGKYLEMNIVFIDFDVLNPFVTMNLEFNKLR